jgi:hypothetical protein
MRHGSEKTCKSVGDRGPLQSDEYGNAIPAGQRMMTGTRNDGTVAAGYTCDDRTNGASGFWFEANPSAQSQHDQELRPIKPPATTPANTSDKYQFRRQLP